MTAALELARTHYIDSIRHDRSDEADRWETIIQLLHHDAATELTYDQHVEQALNLAWSAR